MKAPNDAARLESGRRHGWMLAPSDADGVRRAAASAADPIAIIQPMRTLVGTIRRLWQRPTFALAGTATLAIGIAAPTALFAVLNATLLRPLPYPHAENLYFVTTRMTDGRFTSGMAANEEINSLRRAVPDILGSAVSTTNITALVTDTGAQQVTGVSVSEGFFDLFGVPMAAGRAFTSADYAASTGGQTTPVVVLSNHLWQSAFGADPAIINSTIRLGPASVRVVGVAAPGFAVPRDADFWYSQHFQESIGHTFDAYVRLPAGVTPDQIQARLPPMWDALAKKYPDYERTRAFVFTSLLNTIIGDLGPVVIMAFAATGVLFLLAVVNVINLYLARAASRGREVAVRTALGATRGHLVRQLVGESLVVAAGATLLGIPLAYAAVRTIVIIGGSTFPRVQGMTVDPRVTLFAVLLMGLAGLLVGLAPLLTVARPDLTTLVNEGGRSGTTSRATHRMLGLMIAAEVTLAIALVAGAGRLLLSLSHQLAVVPGFVASGRLAVDVSLTFQPYGDPNRFNAWLQDVDDALHRAGAQDVAVSSSLPFRHEWDQSAFTDIVGHPTDPAHRPNSREHVVSPNYFAVMGTPMVAGRAFTVDDRTGGNPVVIVSQAWVRRFIPDLDPLRQQIEFFGGKPVTIVGVVRDVSYADLTKEAEPAVFVPIAQNRMLRLTLVVTSPDGHPERLSSGIRSAIAHVDSRVPVETELLSHAVNQALVWPKLGLLLMVTFGGAALVLASIGVFGVIAFVGAQRQNEMAIRLALGGTTGHVFRLVLSYAARLAGIGAVAGLLLAWWMGRLMASYVYQVSAGNLVVLAGSTALVVAVALAATLPSAQRAARTNPSISLLR